MKKMLLFMAGLFITAGLTACNQTGTTDAETTHEHSHVHNGDEHSHDHTHDGDTTVHEH